MAKLFIKNGMIIDGTGRDAFRGDVVVDHDRIESVVVSDGPPGSNHAVDETGTVIDAEGRVVAPGFIDCHSHFDWVLPLPDHQDFLFPMVEQGITTVVT